MTDSQRLRRSSRIEQRPKIEVITIDSSSEEDGSNVINKDNNTVVTHDIIDDDSFKSDSPGGYHTPEAVISPFGRKSVTPHDQQPSSENSESTRSDVSTKKTPSPDSESNSNKINNNPIVSPVTLQPAKESHETMTERVKRRRLILEKIVGSVRTPSNTIDYIVKWKGLKQLERISLSDLRILFPAELVDYMCSQIRWVKAPTEFYYNAKTKKRRN